MYGDGKSGDSFNSGACKVRQRGCVARHVISCAAKLVDGAPMPPCLEESGPQRLQHRCAAEQARCSCVRSTPALLTPALPGTALQT